MNFNSVNSITVSFVLAMVSGSLLSEHAILKPPCNIFRGNPFHISARDWLLFCCDFPQKFQEDVSIISNSHIINTAESNLSPLITFLLAS